MNRGVNRRRTPYPGREPEPCWPTFATCRGLANFKPPGTEELPPHARPCCSPLHTCVYTLLGSPARSTGRQDLGVFPVIDYPQDAHTGHGRTQHGRSTHHTPPAPTHAHIYAALRQQATCPTTLHDDLLNHGLNARGELKLQKAALSWRTRAVALAVAEHHTAWNR